VTSSPATELTARDLGMRVDRSAGQTPRARRLAIDGADQVASWLVTGCGAATLTRLGHVWLRDAPRSPDGGLVDDPVATAARLSSTTRLIERGLFAPAL
jgi:hypothetical protein